LAGDTPAEDVIRQLQNWFAANPVSVRPERKVPRRPPSLARSYQFQRNVRKRWVFFPNRPRAHARVQALKTDHSNN
jgi:hypothetical protein